LNRTAEKAETLSAAQVSANRQEGEAPRARDRDIQAIARKKKREIARHVLAAGSCDKKKTIGACCPGTYQPTNHACHLEVSRVIGAIEHYRERRP
jgi:hypothetical protein